MLLQLLQNYVEVINDTTRMTQRSATAMAQAMLRQAGMQPAADLVTQLSEQLMAAQEAQWAMMRQLIQSEIDMTLARMQLAGAPVKQSPNQADPQLREAPAVEEAAPRVSDVTEAAPSAQQKHVPEVPVREVADEEASAGLIAPESVAPDAEDSTNDLSESPPGVAEQAVGSTAVHSEAPPPPPPPVADAEDQPAISDTEPERTAEADAAESRPEPAAAVASPPAKRAPAARKATARKTTPSKPAATRSTPSKPAATKSTPSKPAATRSTPSKPAATRSTASKSAATKTTPSKPTTTKSTVSKPATTRAPVSKPASTTAKSPSTRSNTAGAGQAASKRKTDAPKGAPASGDASTSGETSQADS